jgi:hypothetical protein
VCLTTGNWRLGEDTNILRLPGIEPQFLGLWTIIRPLYGIYDLQKDPKPKPSYATSSFNLHTTCWRVVWHVLWILHSNLPRALFQYCRINRRPLSSHFCFSQPASICGPLLVRLTPSPLCKPSTRGRRGVFHGEQKIKQKKNYTAYEINTHVQK